MKPKKKSWKMLLREMLIGKGVLNMFRRKEKKTELQKEMDKYMKKMQKLNSQLDNLNRKSVKLQKIIGGVK